MALYSQDGLNDFNNLFLMCVTSMTKITIAAWLPTIVLKKKIQEDFYKLLVNYAKKPNKTRTNQWDFKTLL